MDYIIYDLLLQSEQGLTLLGVLRFRPSGEQAAEGLERMQALQAGTLQRPTEQLYTFGLEGDISVPLLTGLRRVPLTGLAFSSAMAPVPFTLIFSSTDPARNLGLQLFYIDSTRSAGGLSWQAGTPRQAAFSVLATTRAFGMADEQFDAEVTETA